MDKQSDKTSLQVIDWELGQSLAGGNLETAKELLSMLVADLPKDCARIDISYQEKKISKMHEEVHYLYGAICYCAIPALQAATKTLDCILKNRELDKLDASYQLFCQEVNRLLEVFENECSPGEA